MKKTVEMKPGKNGYKIYFNVNTVVMNYKFAAAAGEYGTDEYNYFDWSHRYIVELRASTMRWIATDDKENVSVYTRVESLPEELR